MSTRTQIRLIGTTALIAVVCVVVVMALTSGSSGSTSLPHLHRQPRVNTPQRAHGGGVPRDTTPGHSSRTPPAHSASAGTPVPLNVYAGGGNASGVHAANALLGGAVTGAFDYVPYSSWSALSHPVWLGQAWAGQGFDLTLAVPMFPRHGASLGTCATGAYDGSFTTLARTLIAGGLGHATLVIGWEPETGHYQWSVHTARQARAYVNCWRHIQRALAAQDGAHFTYMWDAGDPGPGPVAITRLYPGRSYVNVIGTSAVDAPIGHIPAARQWAAQQHWHFGADWAARFARAHGTPIAVFMLGLGALRDDNDAYVAAALRWASLHHAYSLTVWDEGHGALLQGRYPAVVAALKAACTARGIGAAGSGAAGGAGDAAAGGAGSGQTRT